MGYAVSWPVRAAVSYDLWKLYGVIRLEGMSNKALIDMPETAYLCSTWIEWRRIPLTIAFHIFLVSVIFRYCKIMEGMLKGLRN